MVRKRLLLGGWPALQAVGNEGLGYPRPSAWAVTLRALGPGGVLEEVFEGEGWMLVAVVAV